MCIFTDPPLVPEPPPPVPEEPDIELGGSTDADKRKRKAQGLRQFRIPLNPNDTTGAGLNTDG
jgi:hypothetical protein